MPPKRTSARLSAAASAVASPAASRKRAALSSDCDFSGTPGTKKPRSARSVRAASVALSSDADPFEFKPESPALGLRTTSRDRKGKGPAKPKATAADESELSALEISSSSDDEPRATRRPRPVKPGKKAKVDAIVFDGSDSGGETLASNPEPLTPATTTTSSRAKARPQVRKTPARSAANRSARKTSAARITELESDDQENVAPKSRSIKRKAAVVSDEDDSESAFEGSSGSESSVVAESDGDASESDVPTATSGRTTPARPVRSRPNRGASQAANQQAREDKARQKLHAIHPELATVWADLEAEMEVIVPQQAEQPKDVLVTLLPFQREGLFWLMRQEESRFKGGILADEMGMGKTLETISLLVSKRVRPNLILTPTVALMQWVSELETRTAPGTFKVLLFHGTDRPVKKSDLLEYDIVLSTYSIVEAAYRKQKNGFIRKGEKVYEKSLIHSIQWARVVLDEAHSIKDRSCSTARAVFNLQRDRQWSLTGTPLQNRVGELYSLIRFMNADPFSYYFCKQCPCKMQTWSFTNRRNCDGCGHTGHQHFCWWNAEILKPIQRFGGEGDGLIAFKKLGTLLDRVMLRRTKLERTEELGLPPRVVTVRSDVFNEAEEELYESLYSDSARTFSTYVEASTVLNNYASIFSLLSRMRLAVNHPDLVTTKLARDANTANEILVCGICGEEAEDAISARCKHTFCREDARQYIQSAPEHETPTCPVCYKPLSIDLTMPEVFPKTTGDSVKKSIVNYIDMSKWRSSTKIEALVEELTALQRDDSTAKSIVFSQFVSFLDLIQWRLSRAGFNVVKLDGTMPPAVRASVINQFMTDPSVTVFLVSLKAGGVALNLTEASRVFLTDPWWNGAAEDQAIDRIHRLGQRRPIKITRLIVSNSIESRILQLQEKKRALFASTVGKDMEALSRLSEEDLRFLFVL